MAKRNFDTRIEELRRREEELRVERQRIESAKREHERRERARRLSEMGRIAALLEHLAASKEGVTLLEDLGVARAAKWPSGAARRGSDGAGQLDAHNPTRGEVRSETPASDTLSARPDGTESPLAGTTPEEEADAQNLS